MKDQNKIYKHSQSQKKKISLFPSIFNKEFPNERLYLKLINLSHFFMIKLVGNK